MPLTDPWTDRRAVSESQHAIDPDRFGGTESGFARWIAPRLAGSTGTKLVEVGCGPGRDVCHYARQGFAVLGIDHAPTAVEDARQRVALLPEPARSRARIVYGEVIATLLALPERSQDAVVAHLVYGSFTPDELSQLSGVVARCLRPGGTHAFAVRATSDPRFRQGQRVGPETLLGGPHLVPYRYFTLETAASAAGPRFALEERQRVDAEHLIYVRTRRDGASAGPSSTL
jgi:SAM-dependent methyltransferase